MPAPVDVAAAPIAEISGLAFPLSHARLANGLDVYVQPRPGATSTVAYLFFNAGSRYETEADSGVSHLLEHMLFVGTPRWSEDALRAVVDRAGGRFNGQTWPEQVGYWAQMPADHTPELLNWLGEIAFHSTLPADKLDKEREVVFEERDGRDGWTGRARKAIGLDRSYRTEIRRGLFPGSSRALAIIGEDASLDAATTETLRGFYARHYHAGNAALVVVGPTPPEEIVALAQAELGALPGGARTRVPTEAAPPPLGGTTAVRQLAITDRCTVTLAARGPGLADPDLWAMVVLMQYLDIGLTDTLRGQRGLTYGIDATDSALSDGGELRIESDTDCANVDTLAEAFGSAVDAVRGGTVDAERLDRARRKVAGSWLLEVEDSRTRAEWIGHRLPMDDPFGNAARQLAVPAVTEADVVGTAGRWLTPPQRGVWVHRPLLTVAQAWWAGGVGALLAVVVGWRRLRR